MTLYHTIPLHIPQSVFGVIITLQTPQPAPFNLIMQERTFRQVGSHFAVGCEVRLFVARDVRYSMANFGVLTKYEDYTLYNFKIADYGHDDMLVQVKVQSLDRKAYTEAFMEADLRRDTVDFLGASPYIELQAYDEGVSEGIARWYRGDFHSHTTVSDGHATKAENDTMAKDAGLDFFHATDHTVFPTGWAATEGVSVLPATEITTPYGHFNYHFSTRSPFDGLPPVTPMSETTLLAFFHALSASNRRGLLAINHSLMPPWDMTLQDFPMTLCHTMEVITDPGYRTATLASAKALKVWSRLWNWGNDIVGIGASDNHFKKGEAYDGALTPSCIGIPSTYVLSRGNGLAALRQGFVEKAVSFCERGLPSMVFTDSAINGEHAGQNAVGRAVDLKEGELCFEWIGGAGYHQWVVDGRVVQSVPGTLSTFTFNQNDGAWVRVDVRDHTGRYIGSTNPLRFKSVTPRRTTWGEATQQRKLRGVLFDKDGTLIQFSDLWADATTTFIATLCDDPDARQRALSAVGIDDDGVRPGSPLAAGTLDEIAAVLCAVTGKDVDGHAMETVYGDYMTQHPEVIRPAGDIAALFTALKAQGLAIGVVSSDNHTLIEYTLDRLGVRDMVDGIYSGDRYPAKPDPTVVYKAAEDFGLDTEELAVVGDSPCDMFLGYYAGCAIGVKSDVSDEFLMRNNCDRYVETVDEVARYFSA
ncbi:CehA/McbA family metallohydrolase [Peptoniphilus equinus]|uniref:CehA/McbA family metallohydrolase n=1 Tax=Peptoniphilus equinus TaxID=3016343 RepID=A0ABY7QSN2_9FIRM|nr:CehA/McbA family metallohydrolase [Peptoniphilus equinus]WBW49807.1 CehA/McbA family metallohydrolase [Peptoniphilus equinus]